jgi:hypothetical protein
VPLFGAGAPNLGLRRRLRARHNVTIKGVFGRGSKARAVAARSVAQIPRGSPLSGLHMEPKLCRGSANAVIKTQKLDPGDGRTNGQC